MSIDAPIIDEFDDGDSPRRRSTWGFSNIKRTMAKSKLSGSMVGDNSNSRTLEKGDIKAKRKSWKDLANIREYLEGIDDSLADVVKNEQKTKLNPSNVGSGSQERRKWFIKLRYQQQLVSRLSGIEKTLKGKGGSGLGIFGLLGSMGALGTLLKGFKNKGLGMLFGGKGGGVGGNIGKQVVSGLLTALLAKSAIGHGLRGAGGLLKLLGVKSLGKGADILGGAKTFGRKALGSMGTMLKAGKARLMTAALPSMGLGGLAGSLGSGAVGEGSAALTAMMRAVLPKLLAQMGLRVFGVPGAVVMTAKLIWDNLLPDSWKRYITYKVSKFYLAAIDKVASMFEWIANTFDSIKNKVQEFYNSAVARVYAAMDFVSDLITGEGDARSRVKNYMSNIWRTLELTISTYVGGFVTVFKNAYASFVKPFYDEKGNFSLARGIKYYAKAGYDFGANAINTAGAAIDDVVNSAKKALGDVIDSAYNPANWQRNSEEFVKRYEQEEAAKAKNTPKDQTNQLIAKTQDATQNTLNTLDKTLKSTNKYLQVAANAATGLAGSFMNGYNATVGGGGSTGVYTTDGSGGGLGGLIAKAESGGNYNAFNRGNAGDSKQGQYDFTKMTIGQVMSLQAQGKVFAVGKYQMIPDTMTDAVKHLNLGKATMFTPEIQEYMFQNYLVSSKRKSIKGFITGQSNNLQAAQMDISREFASIGVPYSGREGKRSFTKGGTYYGGEGNNKASVSDGQSAAALQEARAIYAKAKQSGKTDQEAWNEVFKSGGGTGLTQEEIQTANSGVSSSPTSTTTGNDPMAAILATMQDPEKARAAYEQAKIEFSGQNVELDGPASIAPRVSSIGSQINQDIRYPNDIGAVERAKRAAKEAAIKEASSTIKPSSSKASPVVGSGQSALFNRMNMANVNHENAFPV